MGMPKNSRDAALPYSLKTANNSRRMVGTASAMHMHRAIVILSLAANRLFGCLTCPVPAAGDALVAIV